MSTLVRGAAALFLATYIVACGGGSSSSDDDDGGTSNGPVTTTTTTQGATATTGTTGSGTSTEGASNTGTTGSGGATNGGGNTTGTTADPDTICQNSCEQQAACLEGVEVSACVSNCETVQAILSGDCVDKQLAEFECVGTLSCDEMLDYFDDKLGHESCGAVYSDFATSCLFNGGTPPQECVDFCTTASECDADAIGVAGCSQNCNEALSGFEVGGGTACAGVLQDIFGCYAGLTCAELEALQGGAAPAACSQYDDQLIEACQ